MKNCVVKKEIKIESGVKTSIITTRVVHLDPKTNYTSVELGFRREGRKKYRWDCRV